jgi:cell division protein FtsI/penicillin-binding protein 2
MSRIRVYFLVTLVGICIFSVLVRLYDLQIGKASFYRALADNQHNVEKELLPQRGTIFLKGKDGLFPIATNRDLATVFAVPAEMNKIDLDYLSEKISDILKIDKQEVFDKLSKENDSYELLKRKISAEEKEQLVALKIKGIYFFNESWRYYPANELASQLIGFVGYNQDKLEGLYGVEKYFESSLSGLVGKIKQEKDAGGRWISIGKKEMVPVKNGKDLVLTVDRVIQFKTELILKKAVEKHGADGGRIIVMEPVTGKILAMANEPSFDLNNYSSVESLELFKNSNVSDAYECGSVFKPFTMAAGLDTGKINSNTTYIDTGQAQEAGYVIKNSDGKAYGQQTMTEVIEKSLNTGVIFVEKEIGNKTFLQYVENFGFGKKTGVDLPYEVGGNISNLKTNRNIEYFTASFGQGITVTPIQLANAYAALANGGELLVPQIVEETIQDGKRENQFKRNVVRKVISKNTANQIALMLESNVKNGHGKQAKVPGYRIGGKTGTAQIPDREKGGYLENATIGTFAGFAPIDDPRFVILVIIDNPKDVEWAESTAAPVFGELAKFIFDYYNIEPTEEYTEEEMNLFNRTHNYIKKEEKNENKKSSEDDFKEDDGED